MQHEINVYLQMTQNHSVYEIQHAISIYMYILLSNIQLIHVHIVI